MQTSSRILLNTATNWAARLTTAVVSLLLVPFLLQILGKQAYGLIALVGVIVSMTAIADLGLRGAMSRQLAEQVARKDTQRFNELFSSGVLYFAMVGTIGAAACFMLTPLLARAFNVSDDLFPDAVFLIRWFGSASILFSFLLPACNAVLVANNRFDVPNNIGTVIGLAQGLTIFGVLATTGAGLRGWAAVMLTSMALQVLLSWRFARKIWPDLRLRWSYVRRDAFASLFSLGGKLFLLQLTGLLAVHADPIILTRILGPASVALYRPAAILSTSFQGFVNALSEQLHPLATAYHTTERLKELQSILLRGTRYTLLMGIPVCVLLGIFAEPITRVWLSRSLGDEYRITAMVLGGWALIDLATYAAGSQWPVLLGMNRLNFVIWTQLPSAVVNIVVSVILVRYTTLGVVGVVVPTVVIGLLRRPVMVVYTAMVVGLRPREYFVQSYLRPLLVLLVLAAAAGCIMAVAPPRTLMGLLTASALIGALWVACCWLLGFDEQDRRSFRELLVRVRTAAVRGARSREL